jgi:hypothetical protein
MLSMLLVMLEDADDQRRFLKVHAAYEQKMYRVALQVLKSSTLAEDAVQQCWVQIIGHFDQVKQSVQLCPGTTPIYHMNWTPEGTVLTERTVIGISVKETWADSEDLELELPYSNHFSTLIWTDPDTGVCFRLRAIRTRTSSSAWRRAWSRTKYR